VVLWLWYKNPEGLISWWNYRIANDCERRDLIRLEMDPPEENQIDVQSYQSARVCSNPVAMKLNTLINLNHDNILIEVIEALKLNSIQKHTITYPKWLKQEDCWNPLWIKYMGEWAASSEHLPTLKRIASFFPDITVMHVSIFHPGSTIIEHSSPSRAVHRYHYGLKIPKNDVGLKIGGKDIQWIEKEGFIWDDTIPHSVWNHTSEPRIVIFADILRPLSLINSLGTRFIYALTKRTKYVTDIKTQLSSV